MILYTLTKGTFPLLPRTRPYRKETVYNRNNVSYTQAVPMLTQKGHQTQLVASPLKMSNLLLQSAG